MRNKAFIILLHITLWLIFLCIPHYFFGYVMELARINAATPPAPLTPSGSSIWFDSIFVVFNFSFIAFYYINTLILIPRLLTRQYRWWYILSIMLFMIIIVSLPSIVLRLEYLDHPEHHEGEYRSFIILIRILFTTLVFAIIFIISTGMRIVKEWYQAEQRARDVRHEKAITELSLLKAQINPHFLFNTLNNIYSLSVRHSDDAPQAVMMLADMMRYVLSDAQCDQVQLDKELEYLSEYIKLQKLRLTDKVVIQYTLSGRTEGYEIAPMMIMPFVENAFKYGISTHEDCTIIIDIKVANGHLTAHIRNKILPQANQVEKATGTGLANVRRRLELLYPDGYTLQIDPDDHGYYNVSLHLKLA